MSHSAAVSAGSIDPTARLGRARHNAGARGRPSVVFRMRLAALPVALLTLLVLVGPLPARAQASPEEELVQRFAPISYLKQGDGECDPDGEPFLPAPVDVVFNDPAVRLREAPMNRDVARDFTGAALFRRDERYFVDLPGNPRTPGCGYERRFKERMGDQRPVVYAHIATEEGKPGLAVQYWFWYYFNDFNNKHEGDWEMIQLLFDVDSVEAALEREPVEVAFAQHDGGELAGWDDPKLEKEGSRPVTYPSRGSHASYFGPAVWLGWGEQGSGLGCDDTTGPSFRVDPEVRLIGDAVDRPDDPRAWATFGGRWGERDSWVFDGPTGPNLKPRWTQPISWQEGLRRDSLALRSADVVGPAPTAFFCDAVAGVSAFFALAKPYPWLVYGGLALALAVAAVCAALALPILREAWRLYRTHLPTFAGIAGVVVPLTLLVSGGHYLLSTDPGFAAWTGLDEDSGGVRLTLSAAVSLQRVLLVVLVGPAVVQAVADIQAGRRATFGGAYRRALAKVGTTAAAVLRASGLVFLLGITLVGLPWAVTRAVRWLFVPQAVILDDRRGKEALAASAAAVRGRWWRTAATMAALAFVAAAVGPLVGLLLMIPLRLPLELANGASAIVYAVTQPLAVIGGTLLYRRLKAGQAIAEPGPRQAEPVGQTVAGPAPA